MSGAPHPLDRGQPPPWAVEWGKDRHGVFCGFAVGDVIQRLRWIRPGTFMMGSPEGEAGRFGDEGPQHRVTITRGYWLADTPVTQELWQAVMGHNPSKFQTPKRPVENVSWDDCRAFLDRLAGMVAASGWRLPTEAEWEYACRAGTTEATWAGDLAIDDRGHAKQLDDLAWYDGNSGRDFDLPGHERATRAVGTRKPNPWGLHDMLGNVWEWCSDWYGEYGSEAPPDPVGPSAGSIRVMRGGSWIGGAWFVRAAVRGAGAPGDRDSFVGFRLARGHP